MKTFHGLYISETEQKYIVFKAKFLFGLQM